MVPNAGDFHWLTQNLAPCLGDLLDGVVDVVHCDDHRRVLSRPVGFAGIEPTVDPKNGSYPGAGSVGGGVGRPI